MLMIPNVFKILSLKEIYQASKFSSHDFYLTTPKSIKYFKKHNFGWPQKLTHNHMYRVEQGFVCGVCN